MGIGRLDGLTRCALCIVVVAPGLPNGIDASTAVAAQARGTPSVALANAPTRIEQTKLRGGPGVFFYPRQRGAHHGVDIVPVATSRDRTVYRVMAVDAGIIAYVGINGAPGEGYGHTVIIEHADAVYTLYAHLANVASATLVTVGERVEAGHLLGYMADVGSGELSSGNVQDCEFVPLPVSKIQLHFEVFRAGKGRRQPLSISSGFKGDATILDPTPLLVRLGYQTHDPEPRHARPDPSCKAQEY